MLRATGIGSAPSVMAGGAVGDTGDNVCCGSGGGSSVAWRGGRGYRGRRGTGWGNCGVAAGMVMVGVRCAWVSLLERGNVFILMASHLLLLYVLSIVELCSEGKQEKKRMVRAKKVDITVFFYFFYFFTLLLLFGTPRPSYFY